MGLISFLKARIWSLLEANIIELVRQNVGITFRTHVKISPIFLVDSIALKKKIAIAPIPAKTKLEKIVIVYAEFSSEKINELAYVKATIPNGKSKNSTQTPS